jgi:uncharacterized protein (DUF3084 family)
MKPRPTPETDKAQFGTGRVSVNFARRLERERDEAREETIRTREFMDHGFAKAQKELATVTEQRDKLAAALQKVSRSWNYAEVAQQALQSLTPNAEP